MMLCLFSGTALIEVTILQGRSGLIVKEPNKREDAR
jgi:hypothetical protein